MQDYLQSVTRQAIDRHCPKARLSAHAKRWWAQDLTVLRERYTRVRNSTRSCRRQGRPDLGLEAATKAARHDFHHEVRRRKKEHWLEFLDNTNNIGQAARHLDPNKATGFGRIAAIKGQNGERIQDKAEIGRELLKNFFPEPPPPQQSSEPQRTLGDQLCSGRVPVDEGEQALFAASPDKAPGRDGLTIRVWREVWRVLQQQICQLCSASLNQGKLPDHWKVAKIVPLKKGGKDDYTLPKNYRPISLLPTLGKVLEAVVANRIVYLTEVHRLLPKNYFGARKQRSTVHALSYL